MAGAAPGAPPARFGSQAQHLELVLRGWGSFKLVLRGRWSTLTEARGSPVTIDYFRRCAGLGAPRFAWQAQHWSTFRFVLRGMRNSWISFRLVLRGACSTGAPWRSTEVRRRLITLGAASFCVAGAAPGAASGSFCVQVQHLEHLVLRGSTWRTFIEVHGSPATITWSSFRLVFRARCSTWSSFRREVQHLEHLHRGPRKSGGD